MALQLLPTPIVYPGNLLNGGAAPGLGNADTIDAAGEYGAMVFCAQQDMTIGYVGLKLQTATGSPQIDIRIETLSSGDPSGTLWATNTNTGAQTFTTTFTQFALTAPASIAKGQSFAVKPVFSSGTSAVLGTCGSVNATFGSPYLVTNTTGSAVKSSNGLIRNMAIGPSASAFYALRSMRPAASVQNNAFNNTSSAKRGAKITLPFSAQIIGLRLYVGTATGAFNTGLCDTSNNELGSSSTAFDGVSHSQLATSVVELYFDSPVIVAAGVPFYAYVEPTSGTNCNMYTATMPTSGATAAQYRAAWPGGVNFQYATYTSGGGWSDSATDVPFMDLLLFRLSDDIGTGGGRNIIIA